ncbi:hypothetical protein HKA46_003123 [Escherichia coli]|nr:hypothetical protein [Escherichia coli]
MLESGDNICSIPSVSGEDRILQAMIAAFFLLTPLIILILRKLFMREMFEFWLYVFSLVICLGLLRRSLFDTRKKTGRTLE